MARPLRIFERWRPQGARPDRAVVAAGLNLLCAAGAVGLFVLVSPASSWGSPLILSALALVSVVAFATELQLRSRFASYFDASLVLALIALALGGFVPALCVWAIPDVISRLVLRRHPIFSPGMVSTFSGYALALIAAGGVLEAAGSDSLVEMAPALYTAGLVAWTVDFAVARLLFAPFYQGLRVREIVRDDFFDLAPAVMTMLALGVTVIALIPVMGSIALAPLAVAVVMPQLAFAALARSRSVTRLDQRAATSVYARALSHELRLSRFERRLIDATVARLARIEGRGWTATAGEPPLVGVAALGVNERWDGDGPFGICASDTLRASRVISVARAWSSLTAADSPRLSHTEAMLDLTARAGSEFDPQVVESAAEIVAAEGALTRSTDFEPRLHRLPLPASLRSRGLPAIAERLGAPV